MSMMLLTHIALCTTRQHNCLAQNSEKLKEKIHGSQSYNLGDVTVKEISQEKHVIWEKVNTLPWPSEHKNSCRFTFSSKYRSIFHIVHHISEVFREMNFRKYSSKLAKWTKHKATTHPDTIYCHLSGKAIAFFHCQLWICTILQNVLITYHADDIVLIESEKCVELGS